MHEFARIHGLHLEWVDAKFTWGALDPNTGYSLPSNVNFQKLSLGIFQLYLFRMGAIPQLTLDRQTLDMINIRHNTT